MSKRILFICLVLLVFVLGIIMFFVYRNNQTLTTLRNKLENTGGSLKDQSIARCEPEDEICENNNEAIKASKLTGQAVEFARHQCDGPKPCPIPDEKKNEEAIKAIRVFEKEPNLEPIRITGITPSGNVFYCATDGRCWSYDTKSKDVILYENKTTPEPSPSTTILK